MKAQSLRVFCSPSIYLALKVSSIVFPFFFRAEATLMASVCAVGLESVGNFHFA